MVGKIKLFKPKLSDFWGRDVPRSWCSKICEIRRHTHGYVEEFRKSLMRERLVQIESKIAQFRLKVVEIWRLGNNYYNLMKFIVICDIKFLVVMNFVGLRQYTFFKKDYPFRWYICVYNKKSPTPQLVNLNRKNGFRKKNEKEFALSKNHSVLKR